MNDSPLATDPPVNLGTIPTNRDLFFSIGLFNHVNKVKGEDGRICVALYLRINHVVAFDPNLSSSASYVFLHRVEPIEPFLARWIEVCHFRCHYLEITLRIAFAPPIECCSLHRDY